MTWKERGKDHLGDTRSTIISRVRADKVPGLLYAGTETGFYYSNNDGDSWTPTPIELASGTHQRYLLRTMILLLPLRAFF